jgi:hypothetical protein
MGCDYRQVLYWWLDLLHTLETVLDYTVLYSSPLHTHKCPQSLLHCHCLVVASNSRRSTSCGFLNCPRPQLPASNSNSSQLNPSHSLTATQVIVKVMLQTTVSQPGCLGVKPPSGVQDQIFVTVEVLWVCWCGEPSVTRGHVCCLQLLLALARTVIFGFESCGTHDHILLSQIQESRRLEGQVPVFISPRLAQLYP